MMLEKLMKEIKESALPFDFNRVSPRQVEAALNREHRDIGDLAALLSPAAADYLEPMARLAQDLTRRFFGRNISLFAPLYLANHCINECVYCGYNRRNDIIRARLSPEEIEREAEAIAAGGIRDLLVLTGESRKHSDVGYIAEAIGLLGRYFPTLGLEVYPLTVEEYREVQAAGADFVSLYQETYDPELYAQVHLSGPKRDYAFRLGAQERALAAGFRGVSFGALLGLGDFRRDVLACGLHALMIQEKFPEAEIGFSVPRIRPFPNPEWGPAPAKSVMTENGRPGTDSRPAPPHQEKNASNVGEAELLQVILALRLFRPWASISLSTRESARFRDHSIGLGVTRLSAGVSTAVGGYSDSEKGDPQFHKSDQRGVEEVCRAIVGRGAQPVFNDHVRL